MLLGLGVVFDLFIVMYVIDKIYVDAYQPFSEQKISMQEALDKARNRYAAFMLRQTRESRSGAVYRPNSGPLGPEAVPMRILLPAYVTSELRRHFRSVLRFSSF